ncbi:2,3-bisphosphoglycerate-independent phosphoglycerate mutase [Rhodothermus marinus]|uniref:2,3-bisphosphoglycerate-independent phosphoglycerate mutase n=1 Tax=Rhodothermus marinus TaxID=29549 RepID=UPI000223DCE0|nr:2,3-bisphosphoglycerate-independent phosphoglycerate mutase [Rhodothermus marinus]AEN73706.1 2,3-bisphosphoglycerate-independent phosphoglycerate mutase [Rhodothermus marinus SG0.5JP17-172]MBO2492061.1 2,3-bisphosphoglycerate-independent phosphoglycerate mutase [Rhodothermus marinus]BBM70161.1 2,3-bisphosphoglycerate-independent phosphoglycerate mutase [Rhodothermus marinus]BBM73147.1 2,3-bisphosphoglycerate-independent phosphoglycerate mutase [Rhodothermus marinus]
MDPKKRHLLVILDGYGIAEDPSVSAIDHARKPFLDHLFATYPHATLKASGLAVGLPEGQMGNSEVGHLNLGAGRVVYQEITRIDKEIEEGTFFTNEVLVRAARHAREHNTRLHLMGCFSDGGVHASLNHLFALLELARREGLRPEQVCVHAFTDGRDTDPKSGVTYVRQFQEKAREIGVGRIVSIVGRYYAMDRDKRWDRTEKAYRLLVYGEGEVFDDPVKALEASYAEGVTDEFVKPRLIDYGDGYPTRVADGDAVIFYNFRADRARQLTRAFTDPNFDAFDRGKKLDLLFVTFAPYDETFDLPVAFEKVNLRMTLGEVISKLGGRQLRIAETEKYAHVTYFFSGGREEPFEGEDRILVPSPKVPTYDLKPEMSAPEVARRCAEAIEKEIYNLIVLNFANPDMVGHTGVFEAAVKAIEAVDAATKVVVEAALKHGYTVTVLADHGNADRMKNPDGSPHTAHTTALVPHLIIKPGFNGPIKDGKLGDVAPTILRILGEEIPPEMTGEVLI